MKHNISNDGKRLSSEFSIEFFDNIPSTVSLIDRYKFEDKRLTEKLKVFNSSKGGNKKHVTLKLGIPGHISSHRNLLSKEIIQAPDKVGNKGYGSSHHFHRQSIESELNSNSIESHNVVFDQQANNKIGTKTNFFQHRSMSRSPQRVFPSQNKRTTTQQVGLRSLPAQAAYGNKINQESKYEVSTLSHKTQGILDSQNNTWTHLPNNFFDSKTEGSLGELQSVTQTIIKKRTRADYTLTQIDKALNQAETVLLNSFNDAIKALSLFERGFERIPKAETFIKSLINLFTREEKRLTMNIEVIKNQNEIRVQEYERLISEARAETEKARLKLIDEENFRLEMMKPEKQAQIKKIFSDWAAMDSLANVHAPDYIEDKFFSGVSDPLEVIFNINQIEEKSIAQTLQLENNMNLGEIIERQSLSLKQIEAEQTKLLRSVQQQTALTVLKRFYRHVMPLDKAAQTDADLIQSMIEDFNQKLNLQLNQYNLGQIKYQDLKKDHEQLQQQLGNTIREKREKMVIVAKLERELFELGEQKNHLQQELDNTESRQQFRISRIEEQTKEINNLQGEIANLKSFSVDLENQIKAKKMQIQHYQQESSDQTDEIEKLKEENTKLNKECEETKQKLSRAVAELKKQIQQRPGQQSDLKRETIHEGKDYRHLLEKNILTDTEFDHFIQSLKVEDRVEFEAEILEAAHRTIEQWFQKEAVNANSEILSQMKGLKQKIQSSYQDKRKMLQGRRGGVYLSNSLSFSLQESSNKQKLKEDSKTSSSIHSIPEIIKKDISQPVGQQIIQPVQIKQQIEITKKEKAETDLNQNKIQEQIQPKQKATKYEEKPIAQQVRIKVLEHRNQEYSNERTNSTSSYTQVEDLKPVTQQELKPNLKQQRIIQKRIPQQSQETTFKQKQTGAIHQQGPIARESHTVVVKGKCQECRNKLSQAEKEQSAQMYEVILKLEAILGEKVQKFSTTDRIFNQLHQRLQNAETKKDKQESFQVRLSTKSSVKSIKNKRAFSKSLSPHVQQQQSQISSTVSRMGPTISYQPKNATSPIDTPNPLLEFGMLIHDSGNRTPRAPKVDSQTQTEVTLYDRENLLALQKYLGKRIVYHQADVYSNLQLKMRHPDVPFIGQPITRFEPVLGQKSYGLNKSNTQLN